MANQTISVSRNLDDAAIAGLLNGEDITVNTGASRTAGDVAQTISTAGDTVTVSAG